jgi:hypothetical protein
VNDNAERYPCTRDISGVRFCDLTANASDTLGTMIYRARRTYALGAGRVLVITADEQPPYIVTV